MKRNFTPLSVILFFLLLPSLLFAQENRYSLMLNSGKITPLANVDELQKESVVFQNSLFGDKHYVTIQFNSLPTEEMKAQLKQAGVELFDYIPYMAYTASIEKNTDLAVLKNFQVRSVINFTDYQKTVPFVLSNTVPAYAEKLSGFADMAILVYEKMPAEKIRATLGNLNTLILADEQMFRMFTIRVPKHNVRAIAGLPFVLWAEFITPPNVPENTPGRLSHRINNLNDGVRNLKGDGMRIGVWDEVVSPHLDFGPAGRLVNVDPGAGGSHGTHLSGTIGGKGTINPLARGMAPNATLYSYNGYDGGGSAFDLNLTQMATVIPANTLISSNHSYHDGLGVQCNLGGAATTYTLRARNVDVNLNNFDYHLHVHSAGNAQASCASGWFSITGTGKVAKNNLVVAALTSADAMTNYSSFGPSNDGRVKPEISAVGDAVFSTHIPLNTYTSMSGTSMATPGIAGTVAVLAQRYKELNGGILPPSTLIKNITLNTAQDLGNVGPDYRFGYGRMNALGAVRILEQTRYVLDNVTTGTQRDITITIPANTARLRVMLTWNDPAAAANASLALVNNLDLRVINGATTSLPWVLDPAAPSAAAQKLDDNISNIEQVTIDNPPAGTYTLRVIGEAVPTGPNQVYALTWDVESPRIEVGFPNGGETLGSGTTHTITWDNAGVTGTQTVEYSLDNGAIWNVISSTVAAATTRLNWAVPGTANTSTALIRISSGGTIIDMSDATFKILGNVAGFSGSGVSCNAGEVIFNWGAVTNATHYDIYRLDATTGDFVVLGSNVTGTTYTATGLTPNASMWFTIRSKNNTTGAVSDRGIAINVTVSNGGGGIGIVGAIGGITSICGSASNVNYSVGAVSGATMYTWTVPVGAIIMSGQGTTSILVDFPNGTSSGNITVRAGNGACETAPSTLAITIGVEPAVPSGGGNQSQTVCPGNPIPTLTATASVPAGHTVVWYSAATGGSVVGSPTLSTAGTITYHAASNNTASGCESSSRMAVTLTINAVASATASAGTATTFCAGGSVVLTANAGTTYSWTKDGVAIAGANAQSYTANASGLYAVTVVTGTCSSTSTAIVVTVNALPTAVITAGGPTTFWQGNNVLLTASAGSSWTWSNGATTQAITVTTAGNYSVTVRNAAGCTANSAATSISVSPSPGVSISASPYTRLFPGLKTTLTANVTPPGNYLYVWFKNGVMIQGATTATLPNIDLSNLGNYTVTVTNTTGLPCSNTSAALAIADSATSKLFIYPSPNNGQYSVVYYTATANAKNTVVVYDSKGALVFKRTYTLASPYQQMNVDMQRNGKGIYRVVLFNATGLKLGHGSVVIQ